MFDSDDNFYKDLAETFIELCIAVFVLIVLKITFFIINVILAVIFCVGILYAIPKFKCRESLLPLCYCGSYRLVRDSVFKYMVSDPIDPQSIWISRVLFKDKKKLDNFFRDIGNFLAGIFYLPKVIKTYKAWHKDDAGEDLVIGADEDSDRKKLQADIHDYLRNKKPATHNIPRWLHKTCSVGTFVAFPITTIIIFVTEASKYLWPAALLWIVEMFLIYIYLKSIYTIDTINTYNNILSAGKKLDEMMGENVFEEYEGIY